MDPQNSVGANAPEADTTGSMTPQVSANHAALPQVDGLTADPQASPAIESAAQKATGSLEPPAGGPPVPAAPLAGRTGNLPPVPNLPPLPPLPSSGQTGGLPRVAGQTGGLPRIGGQTGSMPAVPPMPHPTSTDGTSQTGNLPPVPPAAPLDTTEQKAVPVVKPLTGSPKDSGSSKAKGTKGAKPSKGTKAAGTQKTTAAAEKDLEESAPLTRRQAIILGVIGGLAVAGLGITAIIDGCSRTETGPVETLAPKNPYDWSRVRLNPDGRFYYFPDGGVASLTGVDVSEHDTQIDWPAVAADGIDFAMIRVGWRGSTEGGLFLDEYFTTNLEGARAAGLKVGAYFFSQATTAEEAEAEASFMLDALGGTPLDYPVVFDQEPVTINGVAGRSNNLTPSQYTANALAFCNAVKAAGYQPMIYGNQHDLSALDLDVALSDIPVWYAEYDVSKPTADYDFVMWQYSSTATVAGMPKPADISIHFLRAN